jgi:beta-lactamase class D
MISISTPHELVNTITISSIDKHLYIYNPERANKRFTPASTFKILNTLIALEEKAILDLNEVIKWDGYSHKYPSWNCDQTLETAFKGSCVWFYQALAKRVGKEKYREYFKQISYGQLSEQFDETNFWLNNSLKISALEQIDFLRQVYQRTLPFSPTHYDILNKIMLVEQTAKYTLYGKTGWGPQTNTDVGWFVGYIESTAGAHFFATNLTITDAKDLPIRRDITMNALRIKGII